MNSAFFGGDLVDAFLYSLTSRHKEKGRLTSAAAARAMGASITRRGN